MISLDYDLFAAADDLARNRKFKDISVKVKQRMALISANADLKRADDVLCVALQVAKKQFEVLGEESLQDNDVGICVGSLVNQAIIWYCAATHTRSIGGRRFQIGLRDAPPEVRQAHGRLCGLRDRALAHYGDGGGFAPRRWAIDALVLRIEGSSQKIGYFWQRTNYLEETILDACLCVSFLLDNTSNRIEDEKEGFEFEIENLMGDSDFASIISRFQINGDKFFEHEDHRSLAGTWTMLKTPTFWPEN